MHKVRTFQERHSTVGEWQGSGRVETRSRQGDSRETAGERLGMCKLTFNTEGEWHVMCQSAFIIFKTMITFYRRLKISLDLVSTN
jgi:hypothetical protein